MNEASAPLTEPVTVPDGAGAEHLEREAARRLADALAVARTLHESGQRERYRSLLEGAIDLATRALAVLEKERSAGHPELTAGARSTLLKAHAAKAEDALHGAGQLSLSAQRAPSLEACDDGWQRVEAIVAGAEASARMAASLALELEAAAPRVARAARTAVRKAESAARAARKLVETRNHAYTFHTDAAFSFGEGWYLAAAAVLEGVAIQIEPGKDGTLQAETFLRAAGLANQLRPYRSRPRAMKHTTAIVGRAFRVEPASAQRQLRAAFLGDAPVASSITDWVDRMLEAACAGHAPGSRKVLLWIREASHHPGRNTTFVELMELTTSVERAGLVPVWIGDPARGGKIPEGAVDLTHFWKDPIFRQADRRRAQLGFFEHLKAAHGLVGQLGVTTAGMDGPALMGLPTLYLTDAPNVRMQEWVGAVPGYRELVRERGYLERLNEVLRRWAEPNQSGQAAFTRRSTPGGIVTSEAPTVTRSTPFRTV